MITLHMSLDSLLAAAATSIAVIALIALAGVALRRGTRARAQSLILESTVEKLRRELESATSVAARAARRLKRIEQEHARMVERIDLVESRGEPRFFEQAIDSARHGADSGKLAENFGLSRGEADLISRLHGRKKSA